MPTLPSSPGAVHVKVVEFAVVLKTTKSEMMLGGVKSTNKVVPEGLLETSDQFGTSSLVLMANQY